jgi:hypothetical protein
VSLDLILFSDFLKDASHHKLRVSINFIIFGLIVQKLWVFEILGEVWAGWASVVANQQELTTVRVGGNFFLLKRMSLGHLVEAGDLKYDRLRAGLLFLAILDFF